MKPSTTALILATALLSTATSTEDSINMVGCANIKGNRCARCYKRKVNALGGCEAPQPESDPCLFYIYRDTPGYSQCSDCKPGYALKNHQQDPLIQYTCVKGTVQGCLNEYIFITPQATDHSCFGCAGDKYSTTDKVSLQPICESISSPATNCMWGGMYAAFLKEKECFRCQPGYAVDLPARNCQKASQKGCWEQRYGVCQTCDSYAGYSMNLQGKCFKPVSTRLSF